MLILTRFEALCIYAIYILLFYVSWKLQLLDRNGISIFLIYGAFMITFMNWYEHKGGMNASFLFLAFGLVFLCGRATPLLIGEDTSLDIVSFGIAHNVTNEVLFDYSFAVILSFYSVHVGSILASRRQTKVNSPKSSNVDLYLLVFFLSLPIYLYKNYLYYSYLSSLGGYIEMYKSTEHLSEAGPLLRLASVFCPSAFILSFKKYSTALTS